MNPHSETLPCPPPFHRRLFGLLLCFLLPVSGGFSADRTQQQNGPTIQVSPQALENLRLEFGQAAPRPVSASTPVTGTIQLDATRVHDVVPRISGIVAQDYHALGDRMKTGEPLLLLESKELAASLIEYFESEHKLEHATKSYSREKSLVEKKVSSSELLLKAEHEYRIARINHTASLQLLKLLHFPEAELHRLLEQIDHADLTRYDLPSPADGVIIHKEVRLGSEVKPDQVLYTVADLSQLWVDIQVPIREAGTLRVGASVDLSTAIEQRSATAKIIYIAPVADNLTRTILARAVLDNKDGSWRPGTPVTIQLRNPGGSPDGGDSPPLAVPSGAVFDMENGKAVFVKVSQHSFRLVPVDIGADDGSFIGILSGLKAGDTVVTRNVVQLKAQLMMQGED